MPGTSTMCTQCTPMLRTPYMPAQCMPMPCMSTTTLCTARFLRELKSIPPTAARPRILTVELIQLLELASRQTFRGTYWQPLFTYSSSNMKNCYWNMETVLTTKCPRSIAYFLCYVSLDSFLRITRCCLDKTLDDPADPSLKGWPISWYKFWPLLILMRHSLNSTLSVCWFYHWAPPICPPFCTKLMFWYKALN